MSQENVRNRYGTDGAPSVSQPRLLMMLFDRLVLDVQVALEAVTAGKVEVVNNKLCNAQAILLELHSALDVESWPAGAGLSQLYLWIHNELVNANVKKDATKIKSCLAMLEQLNEAWHRAYDMTTESFVPDPSFQRSISAV